MRTRRLCCLLSVLPLCLLGLRADEKPNPPPLKFSLERLDPRFDRLISAGAKLEELANGFAWTEGPVWVPRGKGFLLFSDIPNNRVVRWEEGKGVNDFLKPVYGGT